MAEEFTTARTVELMKMQSGLAESVNSYRIELEVLEKQKLEAGVNVKLAKESEENAQKSLSNTEAELHKVKEITELSTKALNDIEVLLSTKREELLILSKDTVTIVAATEKLKDSLAKHFTECESAMEKATVDSGALIAEQKALLAEVQGEIDVAMAKLGGLSADIEAKNKEYNQLATDVEVRGVELEHTVSALDDFKVRESEAKARIKVLDDAEPALVAKVAGLQAEADGLDAKLRDFEVMRAGVADQARALAGKEELLRSLYGDMGLKW